MASTPRIIIDESDVGPRPIQDVQFNDAGMVGMFNFGPVSTPTLVTSEAELREKFGTYESGMTGMISGEAFYGQNALGRLWVVRIVPSGAAGAKATMDFDDSDPADSLQVDALNIGTEYNKVRVTIESGTSSGFKATVTYDNWPNYSEVWDNLDISGSNNNLAAVGGPNEVGAGSKLVTFIKKGGADANPANVSATALAGGTNGTAAVADYVGSQDGSGNRTGLYCFNEVPSLRYIFAAQQTHATVHSGLQTYVSTRDVEDGQVLGVVHLADNTDPSSASIGSLDSTRLMAVWPFWQSNVVPDELANTYVAIDGHVTGMLTKLKAHESPSNKEILGLVKPRYKPNRTQVDTLTAKRINPVTVVRNRGVRMRAGYTLSSDAAWSQWAIRNQYDRLEQLAYDATGWAVSENNTARLRRQVADILDAILERELQLEAIAAYQPTVCDQTNNTPTTIANRQLNADIRFLPAYPADFITLGITRLVSE